MAGEFVVIGLGVGTLSVVPRFPRKKVERVFSSVEQQSQLYQLVESIPQRYFDLAREIVDYAQSTLASSCRLHLHRAHRSYCLRA